jgi:hypothetical protein
MIAYTTNGTNQIHARSLERQQLARFIIKNLGAKVIQILLLDLIRIRKKI